jgi:hypothetical protein
MFAALNVMRIEGWRSSPEDVELPNYPCLDN